MPRLLSVKYAPRDSMRVWADNLHSLRHNAPADRRRALWRFTTVQAVAVEISDQGFLSLCLITLTFTQAVAVEIYDQGILSLCLIALTFTQAVAVEIYDQKYSHCVLVH